LTPSVVPPQNHDSLAELELRYPVAKQILRSFVLDAPATYLNWNFILISIPNLLMIGGMVAVFIVALLAPFPRHAEVVEQEDDRDA
jgi:hypothetical protein